MECTYSILIPENNDHIDELLKCLQHDISIEICMIDTKTFIPIILGIAELPVDDMKLLILNKYDTSNDDPAIIDRVIFTYGTQASNREKLIIGKLKLQLKYDVTSIINSAKDEIDMKHIWQQERTINREIPVKNRLVITIHNIDNIDEIRAGNTRQTLPKPEELNLSVHYNPIGELIFVDSKDLLEARKVNEYKTNTIYHNSNPEFNTRWYIDFSVDQEVLSYLEHNYINLEIRHNDNTVKVVGTAKIPLIRLLTSHIGIINEAIEIKNFYGKCFGYLHVSVNLFDAVLNLPVEEEKIIEKNELNKKPIKQAKYGVEEFEITIESGIRLHNPLNSKYNVNY